MAVDADKIVISYDANGGSGAPPQTTEQCEYNPTSERWEVIYILSDIEPVRAGYKFDGWRSSGNTKLHFGGEKHYDQCGQMVTYVAQWSGNNPSPSDTTPPVISGATDATITVGDQFDPKADVTATDDTDGDLTASIAVSGSVDVTVPGSYTLTYTVSDKAGNTATATRTITVKKSTAVTPPPTDDSAKAVDLRVACYRNGSDTSVEGRIIHCPISVIMVDGLAKTGEYTSSMDGTANDGSWTNGIDRWVDRDGPYMTTPAAVQTSAGGSSSGLSYFFGLKQAPNRTQSAAVAAVPTTGAPNSDLILPAALLAACMIGGGLILRKRRDRSRA